MNYGHYLESMIYRVMLEPMIIFFLLASVISCRHFSNAVFSLNHIYFRGQFGQPLVQELLQRKQVFSHRPQNSRIPSLCAVHSGEFRFKALFSSHGKFLPYLIKFDGLQSTEVAFVLLTQQPRVRILALPRFLLLLSM